MTVNYFYSGGSAGCFVDVEKSTGSVHQQHTASVYKRVGEPALAACRADGVSTDDGQPKQAKSRNNPNGRDGPQKSCEVQDCADGQGGDTERISKPVLKNFGWRHSHWLHHCESPGSEGSDGDDIEDVEIVVLGSAGQADASLDASAEGKALQRGARCAAIEVLQHCEAVRGEAEESHT